MNYIGVTYDKLPFYCGDIVQIVKGENAGLTGVVQKFNGFGCYVNVFQRLSRWYSYNEIKGMDKELNLCEILKGHEGETFWSDVFGLLTLVEIHEEEFIRCRWGNITIVNFYPDGSKIKGERCTLFPSKDQRDWNKWIKEQEPKGPKTWSKFIEKDNRAITYNLEATYNEYQPHSTSYTPIEKSALALLKIHQLIEVGYGGNVSKEELQNSVLEKYYIYFDFRNKEFYTNSYHYAYIAPIAFHTKKQAKEFLSNPENVQLLKDYFMI